MSHDHTNLRVLGDILGTGSTVTGSYDLIGLHTGVKEGSFAGKLREALWNEAEKC